MIKVGGILGMVLSSSPSPGMATAWTRSCEALRQRHPGAVQECRIAGAGHVAWLAQTGSAPLASQQGTMLLDAGRNATGGLDVRRGVQAFEALHGRNFAAAWVDSHNGEVRLHADRLASRSLVYAQPGDAVLFASELRCIAPLLTEWQVDQTTLADLLRFRWLVGRETGIAGVSRVAAGELAVLAPGQPAVHRPWEPAWRPRGQQTGLPELVGRTRTALGEVLERTAAGHDAVVVLVSGGVDSALLAALARRTFRRVVGLTARAEGFGNPELARARQVAERLGLEHHVVDISLDYAAEAFPRLVNRLEAPPKHLNNLILMKLFEVAREHAGLVLHGDCADILYGGGSLQTALRIRAKQRLLDRLPGLAGRRLRERLLGARRARLRRLGEAMHRGRSGILRAGDALQYRVSLGTLGCVAQWPTLAADFVAATYPEAGAEFGEWYMSAHLYAFGAASWHRLDRLSAPLDLEICMPFLEPELLAVGAAVPLRLRCVDGQTKPVLRQLAVDLVGGDVARWPKQGFPSPETAWLSGPLRGSLDKALEAGSWVRSWLALDAIPEHQLRSDELLAGTLAGLEEWHRQARAGFA